jgi:hypothetical protein
VNELQELKKRRRGNMTKGEKRLLVEREQEDRNREISMGERCRSLGSLRYLVS